MRFLLLFAFLFCTLALTAQVDSLLCRGTLGDNIFTRGDFGAGQANIPAQDPQIAPGYSYVRTGPPNDGSYTITNNTTNWGRFAATTWINIGDNSPDPNGYMMVVNAARTTGTFYQETVQVCGSTSYEFSADVIAMNIPAIAQGFVQPNLSFLINGEEAFSTGDVPIDADWHTYGFTFVTEPGATEVTLSLVNNVPGGGDNPGNDLALDNIRFRPCGTTVSIQDTVRFCPGDMLSIDAVIPDAASFPNLALQWQVSLDQARAWTNIPNATNDALQINAPEDDAFYRLLIANDASNLSNAACQTYSNFALLKDRSPVVERSVILCPEGRLMVGDTTITDAGTYRFTYPLPTGCDSTVIYEVSIDDTNDFEIVGPSSICEGSNAVLDAGEYTSYQWSTGATDRFIETVGPGLYGVTVTNEYGCSYSDVLDVVSTELSADFTGLEPSCNGFSDGSILVDTIRGGLEPFTFGLHPDSLFLDLRLDSLTAGAYSLLVQDAIGCQYEEVFMLGEPGLFELAVLPAGLDIDLGDSIQVELSGTFPLTAISWTPTDGLSCTDCPDPVVAPIKDTNYGVTARNAAGCIDSLQLGVIVDTRRKVFIPNAFSPNDDGRNDVFRVFTGKGIEEILTFRIFDRWGNPLLIQENQGVSREDLQWDGKINGEICPQGIYVYTLEIRFDDGLTEQFNGDFMLIR